MRAWIGVASFMIADALAVPMLKPLPVEVVAHAGEPFRHSLSPDGKWIAEDLLISRGRLQARLRKVTSGQIVPLGPEGVITWAPEWSPDGTKLAYFQKDRGRAVLWVRDRAGKTREVTGVDGVPLGPFSSGNGVSWLPDNRRLVTLVTPAGQHTPEDGFGARSVPFVSVAPNEPEVTVFGGDEPRSAPPLPPTPCGGLRGRCDLAVVDTNQGRARRLASGIRGGMTFAVPAVQLSSDGRFVAYSDLRPDDANTRARDYDAPLYQWTLCEIDTGKCRTTPEEGLPLENFAMWRDKLPQVFPETSWSPAAPQLQAARPAHEERSRYALGPIKLMKWKNADGAEGMGTLMLPPSRSPEVRLPLIVWTYAGDAVKGSAQADRWDLRWGGGVFDFQILATRGYAVLYPDIPIETGLLTQNLLKAVNEAVDAIVEQGIADPDRLAIMGQSFGSQNTLTIISGTTRFKAAVVTGSVSHPDLVADYLQGLPQASQDQIGAYHERSQPNIGGALWKYPERYRANSQIWSFDKIQTPVLIGKGEVDSDDRFASDAIFLALRRLNKPVEYRIYRSEGHVIQRAANVIDFWNRRLTFLSKHLDIATDADGTIRFKEGRAMSARGGGS